MEPDPATRTDNWERSGKTGLFSGVPRNFTDRADHVLDVLLRHGVEDR